MKGKQLLLRIEITWQQIRTGKLAFFLNLPDGADLMSRVTRFCNKVVIDDVLREFVGLAHHDILFGVGENKLHAFFDLCRKSSFLQL
jgi:hypothetical protein